MFRMVHSQHGATHAYSAGERKELEAKGWAVQTDEEFQVILAAKRQRLAAPVEPAADVVVRRGPGRPKGK